MDRVWNLAKNQSYHVTEPNEKRLSHALYLYSGLCAEVSRFFCRFVGNYRAFPFIIPVR